MANQFRDELVSGLRNAFCTAIELQQNYYGWVGRNQFFITARMAEALMGAAYRLFCNDEPPDPPEANFTGGQCPTIYTTYTKAPATFTAGGVDPNTEVFLVQGGVLGAIQGAEIVETSTAYEVRIFAAANPPSNPAGNYLIATYAKSSYQSAIVSEFVVVRADGLPDNCGDPEPPVPTPQPGFNEVDIDITYTNNDGVDITVPLIFIFADLNVNLKGELTVPIRIDLGGLNFKIGGELNLNNGDINLNFGNRNYNRNGQPNPDGYKPEPDIPDIPPTVPDDVYLPSPTDDNDDTERILRACIVSTSIVPDDISLIYQIGNPNITAPNLGYVSFAINVNGKLSWTSDIPIKNERNFIACPWEGGAVAVRGTPRPGVEWVITPVYAAVEDRVIFA